MTGAASSGVAALDEALGGLYWGDNVVWQTDEDAPVDAFYRAVAGTASHYQLAAFVSLTTDPAELEGSYPGFTVIDARPDSPLAEPEDLLAAISGLCSAVERDLILFEGMEAMTERWGAEKAPPLLLEDVPASARGRRNRLLVVRAEPPLAQLPPRDRGDHPVRDRAR